jgi:hypothetical protein
MRDQQRTHLEVRERRLAHQQLVRENAERVDVRPVIGRGIAPRLLRGHVGRGPDDHARDGQLRIAGAAQRFRYAEVGEEHVVVADHDVLGLDVAVDYPTPVGVGQRPGDVAHDGDRLGDG